MCFSTEASFSAAAVLAAFGGTTLKNNLVRRSFFLAAIPLLFALQQFFEGLIWLHFSYNTGPQSLLIFSEHAFLFFAFLVWPVWIPFSFASVEQISWRRTLLSINLVCGLILSGLNLAYGWDQDIGVSIINHSLQYRGNAPEQLYIYPLIVLAPCFLSSLKRVWIFGVLIAISYGIADYSFESNFVSVWCFFAAIVSLSVYKILKDNQMLRDH